MGQRENKAEKLDRELEELLQGLRVLLPGVQVLFAFLLAVPFSDRFASVSRLDKAFFLTALVTAAFATVFLIAPSAFHRILFRTHEKEWIVLRANGIAIVGTVFLAVAMSCALYVVADVLYGSAIGGATAGAFAGLSIVVWYAIPVRRRARH